MFQIGARPSYASRTGASLSGSVLATRPRTTSQGTFGRVESQQGIGGSVGDQQASFGDRGTQAHQQTLSSMNLNAGTSSPLIDAIQSYNDALGTYRAGTGFSNTSGSGFVPIPGDVSPVQAAGDTLTDLVASSSFDDASPAWQAFSARLGQYGNPAGWSADQGHDYARDLRQNGVTPEGRQIIGDGLETYGIGGSGTNPYSFNGLSGSLPGMVTGDHATTSQPFYSPWTNSPVNILWNNEQERPFWTPDAPLPYGGYGDRFTTPVSQEYTVDASRDVGPSEFQYVPGVERQLQPGQRESFESRDAGEYVPIGGGNFTPAAQFNFGNVGEGYTPLRWQQQMAPDAGTPFTEVASQAATAGTPAIPGAQTQYSRVNTTNGYRDYPTNYRRDIRNIQGRTTMFVYRPDGGLHDAVTLFANSAPQRSQPYFRPGNYTYTAPGTPATAGAPAVPGIYSSLPSSGSQVLPTTPEVTPAAPTPDPNGGRLFEYGDIAGRSDFERVSQLIPGTVPGQRGDTVLYADNQQRPWGTAGNFSHSDGRQFVYDESGNVFVYPAFGQSYPYEDAFYESPNEYRYNYL